MRIGEALRYSDSFVHALGLETVKTNLLQLDEIHAIHHIKDVDKYYSVLPDMRGEFYRIILCQKPLHKIGVPDESRS